MLRIEMGLMKQFFKPTFEKIKQVNLEIFTKDKTSKIIFPANLLRVI